jgi:hypothetical protein
MPFVIVTALVLTACSGQPAQPVSPQEEFAVSLPQIVIDVNSEGVPTVAGISPETVRQLTFGQVDLSGMRVPKENVDWFTNSNIQHLEIRHQPDGLYLYANGKPLPRLGWDDESFNTVGELAGQFAAPNQPMGDIIKMVLPFVRRLGLDVVVRFPTQEGAAAIPLADPNATPAPTVAVTPSAVARLTVNYDDQGVPSIMNVSSRDLATAMGVDMSSMELPPSTMAMLQQQGIQHITLRTTPDAVLIWVNGKPLPDIVWSDENLKNTAELYGQLGMADQSLVGALTTLLPVLRQLDADVVLQFPVPPGAQAIPTPAP